MKTSHFFYFLLAILLFSCGQRQENEQFADNGYESEEYYNEYGNEAQGDYDQYNNNQSQNNMNGQNNMNNQNKMNNRNSKGLKNYRLIDTRNNMLIGTMPIPNDWREATNDPQVKLVGPDGIKVYGESAQFFTYSNDQSINQSMQQSGQPVQPPKSVERFIQEDLVPYAQQQGAKLVNQYPIEQLARYDEAFYAKLWQYMPSQKRHTVMATEWRNSNGKSSIAIVRHQVSQDQLGQTWGYVINMLEANNSSFEAAKQAYIYGLINIQINPQWIQTNNQRDQQLAQQSNASHQNRMDAIKAQGQAILNNGRINSQISDMRHDSYMKQSGWSDAGQSKYVDGIWERRNMTDNNGNQYKVDGYDNNVWMNGNNEYIGTDNPNWNPNVDNLTNDQNWNQLQESDDGYNW